MDEESQPPTQTNRLIQFNESVAYTYNSYQTLLLTIFLLTGIPSPIAIMLEQNTLWHPKLRNFTVVNVLIALRYPLLLLHGLSGALYFLWYIRTSPLATKILTWAKVYWTVYFMGLTSYFLLVYDWGWLDRD